MSKRNSHQCLYRGPAKAIPTQTWRMKLTDAASGRLQFWLTALYVLGLVVVFCDVFIWRA